MIDLHCHSIYSDGTSTPEHLIRTAERLGVEVLALTDHDTLSGLEDFLSHDTEVERVCGTEISIDVKDGTFHLLGLMIDRFNSELNKQLDYLADARMIRNIKILESVSELMGRKVTIKEVSGDKEGVVGRPHIARFLLANGIVTSMQDAFERYLAKGMPLYVDKARLGFEEAAKLIHGAGGITILAHPISLGLEPEKYFDYIADLKEKGLDGIEVFCTEHLKKEFMFYGEIADKLNLLKSAGSDYHGENKGGLQLGTGKGHFRAERDLYDKMLEYRAKNIL